jgi:prevent-host-death family protein
MARLARSKWKLADAKNRFSELVNRALAEGPQWVERRADAVVVLDRREYERLAGKIISFKEFLTAPGPSLKGLDLSRDRSPMREVKL